MYSSPKSATTDNRFETPGYMLANVGVRYRFDARNMPASVRLRIYNATDKYAWYASSSEIQSYEPGRRVMLRVTVGAN